MIGSKQYSTTLAANHRRVHNGQISPLKDHEANIFSVSNFPKHDTKASLETEL